MPSPAKRAAATKAPPEGRPSPKTNAFNASTALEIRPPSASIPGPENVRIELMRHQQRMEKLLQGTVEQIHQAVRQELESLRVKDIDARPMEASSSSISRNLPGMTLEAYFQAQEEKMEKKITKQRTFGSRHTEPAGDMENPLSTLEAWTGDHFPDGASENEEDETSMSQARKSRFNMLEKNKVKGVKDWLEHRKKSQIFMDEVPPWRRWAKHVVRNSKFEWLCAALILLCALMIGAEAHYQVTHVGEQEPLAFRVLNTCFNVAFTVELCLRIMVDQLFFFSCRNASIHWNLLDSILVSIAVVEEFLALVMSPALQISGLKILRMARLARILRIVRVVRFFSELRVMVNGVIGSGKSLCWALLLLVGVNFLFGVVFMQLSVDFLVIKLKEVIKDKSGTVTKLKCSHDPATRDTMPADRKPKVIHWVNAKDCLDAEVRLINPLFLAMPDPMPEGKDFLDYINPEAMVRCAAKVEKALGKPVLEDRYQFERVGYFAPDYDCFSEPKKLSFNRVVPLKESADKKKIEGKGTASRKEAQQAQLAEKERLQKIPPEEFFKSERGAEFSAYDEQGVPTHDKEGNALPKSAMKKLAKDLEKQKKLYESWKASK